MAGDWIKMRGNLWDDPRIAKLVDMTDKTDRPVSEATVVGALYWLWATADQHTEDGILPGLSLRQIDRKTGVQGFGAALCAIGWLADHPDGVRIVNFEEHNGASAKRRSEDAKRKADVRKESDKDRTDSGREADKSGKVPELEKEKEKELEKKNTGRGRTARATRLPAAPTPPPEWLDFLQAERPDLNPQLTYAKFCDYWAAKPGKSGTKLDWLATWRNWVREEKSQAQAPPQRETFRERDKRLEREAWEQMTGRQHPDSPRADVQNAGPAAAIATASIARPKLAAIPLETTA
jgi:hypothetical protein